MHVIEHAVGKLRELAGAPRVHQAELRQSDGVCGACRHLLNDHALPTTPAAQAFHAAWPVAIHGIPMTQLAAVAGAEGIHCA